MQLRSYYPVRTMLNFESSTIPRPVASRVRLLQATHLRQRFRLGASLQEFSRNVPPEHSIMSGDGKDSRCLTASFACLGPCYITGPLEVNVTGFPIAQLTQTSRHEGPSLSGAVTRSLQIHCELPPMLHNCLLNEFFANCLLNESFATNNSPSIQARNAARLQHINQTQCPRGRCSQWLM